VIDVGLGVPGRLGVFHRSLRSFVAVGLIAVPVLTLQAPPAAAAGGLRISADTSYDIRTERGSSNAS
jgi:hypothetical protein